MKPITLALYATLALLASFSWAQEGKKIPDLDPLSAVADDDVWHIYDMSAVGNRSRKITPLQMKDYVLGGGSVNGVNLSGSGTLDIGTGGTLKNGAFSEYGTDEYQLLRWAANFNTQPITQAVGATELGAIKRGILPIAAGGTGAITAGGALTNLGITEIATFDWSNGGNGTTDDGKLARFASGELRTSGRFYVNPIDAGVRVSLYANVNANGLAFEDNDHLDVLQPPVILGNYRWQLPSASGNVLLDVSNLDATKLTGTIAAGRMPAFSGDATSSAGATALTLATVNSNVGTFGGATKSLTATVNAKGLITAISEQTVTPAVGSITGLGAGVGFALAATPNATGGILTYAKIGTSGTTLPLLDGTNSWSGPQTLTLATNSATPTTLLSLTNTQAAINGTQSASPALVFSGQGYDSGASASRQGDWRIYALPVQGNPSSSRLKIQSQINGAGYADSISLTNKSDSSGSVMTIYSLYGSCDFTIGSAGLRLNSLQSTGSGNFQIDQGGGNPVVMYNDAADVLQVGTDTTSSGVTATANKIKGPDNTHASSGTGGVLTIAGGKGPTAGGAVTIATSATNSTAVDRFSVSASGNVSALTGTTNYFAVTSNTATPRELRLFGNYASLGDQAYGIAPYSGGSINSSGALYIGGGGVIGFNGITLFYGKIYNNNMNTIVNILNTAELQMGDDVNGAPINQLIKAADGITGTDRSGANLTIASGDATGSGTSAIIFSTPTNTGSTGTTARLADERVRISGAGLTVGSGTSIAKIKHGTAALSSGTVTVSDSDVAANSRIFVERAPGGDSGNLGDSYSFTVSAGTSFTITAKSANATASSDNSTVSWLMINP